MKNYDHKKIESKIQKEWEKKKIYQAKDGKGKKFYSLIEFPYPSGDGLHVGHIRSNTAMDIISRKRRMEGYNVLYPIGWDAFGLPTENYAIKTGKKPAVVTKKNTDTFRRQLKELGISFDWSREVNTTDPKYYKWTQWIFLQLFKKGLAYKAKSYINWCPKDKIGLANEEAVGGICDRCGSATEKREKEQWMLGITKYAKRLDKDLDLVDYPERVKTQQRNWIGKSEGSEIEFKIQCNPSLTLPEGEGGMPKFFTTNPELWKVLQDRTLEMRKNPTNGEKIMWGLLRRNGTEHHFRRQHIIDRFIVDFVCIEKKLVIEVDGDIHDYQKKEDEERTKILNELSFEVVRFTNDEIIKKPENVLAKIILKLNNVSSKTLSFGEGKGGVFGEDLGGVKVFTTRADTLFGVTYVVLSPEHPLISRTLLDILENKKEVEEYIKNVKKKSEIERTGDKKEKTGMELKGIKAINPANNEEIPVWIADYVLLDYGTGAVMAVPAHDERDFEFAKKYDLEVKTVIREFSETNIFFVNRSLVENWKEILKDNYKWISRGDSGIYIFIPDSNLNKFIPIAQSLIKEGPYYFSIRGLSKIVGYKDRIFDIFIKNNNDLAKEFSRKLLIPEKELDWSTAMVKNGILTNSGKFNNLSSEEAQEKITELVGGKIVTKFKLRDWVFSRQRYWGEPIPIINCQKCGLVAVPEKDLPVKLPEVKSYKPTDSGESPLASISKWVNVKCPKCKGKAKRETDTMPNWAGSSWYYLRYTDPKNDKVFADKKKLKYWTPVDWYNGGMEHTTLHLLYSRFWHKFLYDLKLVPTVEPYQKRTSHGMVLGEGGVKMSKSLGNVINPDDIVKIYGADTLRIYEMFMGPFEESVVWSTESIIGSRRFIERVWNMQYKIQENKKYTEFEIEKAIKKVTKDIEEMKFNTAISTLMIFTNEVGKLEFISQIAYEKFLKILSPFAPHVTEEIWSNLGNKKSIHFSSWPEWDENLVRDQEIKIAVQINGKVRTEILIEAGDSEEDVKKKVLTNQTVLKYTMGKTPQKIIYVKNRVINIVC